MQITKITRFFCCRFFAMGLLTLRSMIITMMRTVHSTWRRCYTWNEQQTILNLNVHHLFQVQYLIVFQHTKHKSEQEEEREININKRTDWLITESTWFIQITLYTFSNNKTNENTCKTSNLISIRFAFHFCNRINAIYICISERLLILMASLITN